MNPPSLSINPNLPVDDQSWVNTTETPIIPADVAMLDPPSPINHLDINGDEGPEELEKILVKWDEYSNKYDEFIEKQEGLSKSGIVPPIEEYRKLHAELRQLYEEIKELEKSLKNKTKKLRDPSVEDRVNSLSSSVMSSSTSSTSQSSGTDSSESSLSSARVIKHGAITRVEETDSSFSSENPHFKSSGDRKESKVAFEESTTASASSTSFSDYYEEPVNFEDEVSITVQVNRDAARKGISACNKHIMREADLIRYSQGAQIELRRINEQIKTLKAVFETMVEVAEHCSFEDIQRHQNKLNLLVAVKSGYVPLNQGKKLEAVPTKKEASSSSSSSSTSQTSVTEVNKQEERIKVIQQVLAQVSALGELNEIQFGEKAREYNYQRQLFIKRLEIAIQNVVVLTSEEMFGIEKAVEEWRILKRKIESTATISTPTSSHLTSTSSSSNVTMTSRPQYKEEERKLEKTSPTSQDEAVVRQVIEIGLNEERVRTVRKALEPITVLTEDQFTKDKSKAAVSEYNEIRKRLIEDADAAIEYVSVTTSHDITEIVTRAKQLEGYKDRIFILENLLKASEQVKKLKIDDTFVGEVETAAKEYNQQYQILFTEAQNVLNRTEKLKMEEILVRIEQLKRHQNQVLKLKAELDLQYSSAATAPLSQADKARYLIELNRLQVRIAEEMDPSFFKDEHHVRVKKYNVDRLKIIGDLEFVRSRVKESIDDRISIRIKKLESRIEELRLENLGLYHLLLS